MTSLTFAQIIESIRHVPIDHELGGHRSVHDLIYMLSKTTNDTISKVWKRITDKQPTWVQLPLYVFPGVYQRKTPVADVTTLIAIAMVIPGTIARNYRSECLKLRYSSHLSDKVHIDETSERLTQATEAVKYTEDPTTTTRASTDSSRQHITEIPADHEPVTDENKHSISLVDQVIDQQTTILINQDKDDRQDSTLVDQVIMDEQTSIDIQSVAEGQRAAFTKQTDEEQCAGVTATTGVELVHHPTTGSLLVGDEYTIESVKGSVRSVPADHTLSGRSSVHDLLVLAGRTTRPTVSTAWKRILKANPEWASLDKYQFPGSGQEPSPVAPKHLMEHILLETPMRDHTQAVKAVVCGDIIDNPSETESMLQHLRYVHSPTPAVKGVLYAVTSQDVNFVKVGRWSGTLPSLRSRYRGQYGPDIQLVTFPTCHTWKAEARMLRKLRSKVTFSELVRKDGWDEIIQVVKYSAVNVMLNDD
jgi:hypothetical protein